MSLVKFNEKGNLFNEKIEIPGGQEDPNMNDEEEEDEPTPRSLAMKDPYQQYLYALETIRQLRARLVRRTNVIDEIRKFYLRDIVTMKFVIREVLSETEKEAVWKEYESNLPSLDLKQALTLHAPSKCEFQVKPCEKCGGQLEVILKDTEEVANLKRAILDSKERENRWREKLAVLDTQIENATREKAESGKSHNEEVRRVSIHSCISLSSLYC
jgi:hypothetical protein